MAKEITNPETDGSSASDLLHDAFANLGLPFLESRKSGDSQKMESRGPAWGDKIDGAAVLPPSPYVFAALTEALKKDLAFDPAWKPANSAQRELLGESASLGQEVPKLVELGLLDGAAQRGSAEKVNEMFARHGIPIKLDDPKPDEIAAGGVFHFKADWKGTETTMEATLPDGSKQEFSAFKKDVKSFTVNGKTVIAVYRDDAKGITMYMSPTDANVKGYDAYRQALELTPGANAKAGPYEKAIIPKMKVRDEGDAVQLLGLKAKNGEYEVATAKIFTSADFDQNGAEIKQGLGVGLIKASIEYEPPAFIMDKPPLVWVVQDGASKPLIAFQVNHESWKDPKK